MHEVFRDLSVFVCGEEFYGETKICFSEHTSELELCDFEEEWSARTAITFQKDNHQWIDDFKSDSTICCFVSVCTLKKHLHFFMGKDDDFVVKSWLHVRQF